MKLLVRWLLGLKSNSNNSATSTLRLLYTVIIHEGDLMEHHRLKSVQLKRMGAMGSALTKGLQEGSALTKGWQKGSALTKGWQKGSALTKGWQEGMLSQRGGRKGVHHKGVAERGCIHKGVAERDCSRKGVVERDCSQRGGRKGVRSQRAGRRRVLSQRAGRRGMLLKGWQKSPSGALLREENGQFCLSNFATLDQLLLEEKQQTCPSEAKRALLVGLMPSTTSDLVFLDDRLFDLITRFVLVLQQTRTGSVTSTGWLLYDEAC